MYHAYRHVAEYGLDTAILVLYSGHEIRQIKPVSLPHFFWPAEEEGEEDGCGDDGGSGRGDKARHEGHKGSHTREETEIPGEV